MPFAMLRLKPGVNAEVTPSQNEAGYSSSSLGRFRAGLFEKLGGWEKFYQFVVGGVPKALLAWIDLNSTEYLGIGTTGTGTILGAISDGVLNGITPQELTSDFAPNFTTTTASATVTIVDPNISDVTAFDAVDFRTPISVGGIILSGVYPIALSLGGSSYRIEAASDATGNDSPGVVPVFDTTNGESTVTVTLPDHGLAVAGKINFPIATTGGGVTIFGTYRVQAVGSVDDFDIAVDGTATSTATFSMNSGDAEIIYRISLGPDATGTGYGIGPYSSGGWGTGSATTAQTGDAIEADDWTLDNWGEILVACPEGGGIYIWQPNTGFQNARMLAGNNAPPYNIGAFVASEVQILIAYGSTDVLDIGVDQNPLTVKWSRQGAFDDFTEGSDSQAGNTILSSGSKIVSGLPGPQTNLLWTDVGIWTMSYSGVPFVFGFVPIGFDCGLIAKHAVVRHGSSVYWMGYTNFWILSGGAPQPLPCTVWDVCFQDLNTAHQDRCFAWSNMPYNEIWWFFPRASTGASEPDYYVKLNTLEGVWDHGPMARAAAIGQSLLGMPIAATPDGVIYQHETSPDADGQPLMSSFVTGDYQLSEGQDMMLVDWVLPDAKFAEYPDTSGAALQITFYSRDYPGGAQRTYGPYNFTASTKFINTRIRGRLISFKVESDDIGSFWRIGGLRFRVGKSGRL